MDFSSTVASQLYTGAILPESIVILTLIVVLVGDLIVGRARSGWIPYAAIAGLLGSVFALYLGWDNPHPVAFLGHLTAITSVFYSGASLSCLRPSRS